MEPNDRRTIKIFRTYDDIKEEFLEGMDETHQEIGMLEPRLVYLRSFSDYFPQNSVQSLVQKSSGAYLG